MPSAQMFGQLMDWPLMTDVNLTDISETLASPRGRRGLSPPDQQSPSHSSSHHTSASYLGTLHCENEIDLYGQVNQWTHYFPIYMRMSRAKSQC